MKALTKLLLASVFFLSACTTNYYTTAPVDDVYYSSGDRMEVPVENNTNYDNPNTATNAGEDYSTDPNYSTTETYTDESGDTYVTKNYYYEDVYSHDDYYDYQYTSRIRRFNNPNYGYNYYHSYYTNMYWYDYNPYSWGVSVYMTYPWWYRSYYRPYWYNNYYSYYGWNSPYHYYRPYYGYGYGYG